MSTPDVLDNVGNDDDMFELNPIETIKKVVRKKTLNLLNCVRVNQWRRSHKDAEFGWRK